MPTAINALGASDAAAVKNYVIVRSLTGPTYRSTLTIDKTSDAATKYSEAAAWHIDTGYSDFVGQTYTDPVMAIGYNVDFATGRKDANEPSLGFWAEADYWTGSQRWAEIYGQYFNGSGAGQLRPFFWAIDRADDTVISATLHIPATNALQVMCAQSGTPNKLAAPVVAELQRNDLRTYCDNTGAPNRLRALGKTAAGAAGTQGQLELGAGTTDDAFRIIPGVSAGVSNDVVDIDIRTKRVFRLLRANAGGGAKVAINTTSNEAALCVDAAGCENWTRVFFGKQVASAINPVVELQDSSAAVRWLIDNNWNTVPAAGASSGTISNGFQFVPTMSGTATLGTPPAYTGRAAMILDTVNNRVGFYYGGSWKYATVA